MAIQARSYAPDSRRVKLWWWVSLNIRSLAVASLSVGLWACPSSGRLPSNEPKQRSQSSERITANERKRVRNDVGKGKRPRDPNQLAKWIVDQSTNDTPEAPAPPAAAPVNLSEYMAAIGRKGGQIGGKRRLKTMTKAERSKVAAKAARLGCGGRNVLDCRQMYAGGQTPPALKA
jgi:hypothetical protein